MIQRGKLGRAVGKSYDAARVLADDRTGAIVLFFRGRYFRPQMLRRDTINT